MRLAAPALLVAVLAGLPAAAAPARPGMVLEGEDLRLAVTAEGGARLTELYSRTQKRNLVDTQVPTPLYQIEIRSAGAPPVDTDALRADTTRLESDGPGSARLVSRHASLGLEVVSTIRLGPRDRVASFRIEVRRERSGDDRIGIIRYPGFTVPVAAARGAASLLLPVADGLLLPDVQGSLRDGETACYDYPGIASAQILAVYDGTGGVAAYPSDGEGRYKRLCARRQGRGAQIYTEHVVYDQTGPVVGVPYAVSVGAFQGGWTGAADLYKSWALTQPWCRTKLGGRPGPDAAARPSFFLGANLREARGAADSVDRIPETPAFARSWKEFLGLPVTAILLSWEKNGPWISPDAFPPFGGERAFTDLLGALHRDGDRGAMFLSGLNVTIEKSARNGAPRYAADRQSLESERAAAVVDPDGQVRIDGTAEGEGVGSHLVICPATPRARDLIVEGVRRALALGADVVQIDQVVGGGTPPCFATTHGHPPGGGATVFASLSRLLDEARELASRAPQRAAVSLEEPGELYIPHVDLFHCREYVEGVWPRDRKGGVGVPLFAYLYHEFAAGYGGDSAPLAGPADDPSVALYAQAANLASGRLPGAAVWMKMVPPASLHPDLARFMKDAAALWGGEAAPFLLRGSLFDPGVGEGKRRPIATLLGGRRYGFEAPSLLARGFRLEDGTSGALYVNLDAAPATFPLRLGADRPGGAEAETIGAGGGRTLRTGENVTLPPRGLLFAKVRR